MMDIKLVVTFERTSLVIFDKVSSSRYQVDLRRIASKWNGHLFRGTADPVEGQQTNPLVSAYRMLVLGREKTRGTHSSCSSPTTSTRSGRAGWTGRARRCWAASGSARAGQQNGPAGLLHLQWRRRHLRRADCRAHCCNEKIFFIYINNNSPSF